MIECNIYLIYKENFSLASWTVAKKKHQEIVLEQLSQLFCRIRMKACLKSNSNQEDLSISANVLCEGATLGWKDIFCEQTTGAFSHDSQVTVDSHNLWIPFREPTSTPLKLSMYLPSDERTVNEMQSDRDKETSKMLSALRNLFITVIIDGNPMQAQEHCFYLAYQALNSKTSVLFQKQAREVYESFIVNTK